MSPPRSPTSSPLSPRTETPSAASTTAPSPPWFPRSRQGGPPTTPPGPGEEEEEEEERRGWSWRYVANLGQVGEEWFEDVVGLLDWYKSYGEPQEADWSVTAEEVFSAC
ncbi:hypothetical protein PG988_004471 [Apiospora saccharicola]